MRFLSGHLRRTNLSDIVAESSGDNENNRRPSPIQGSFTFDGTEDESEERSQRLYPLYGTDDKRHPSNWSSSELVPILEEDDALYDESDDELFWECTDDEDEIRPSSNPFQDLMPDFTTDETLIGGTDNKIEEQLPQSSFQYKMSSTVEIVKNFFRQAFAKVFGKLLNLA